MLIENKCQLDFSKNLSAMGSAPGHLPEVMAGCVWNPGDAKLYQNLKAYIYKIIKHNKDMITSMQKIFALLSFSKEIKSKIYCHMLNADHVGLSPKLM